MSILLSFFFFFVSKFCFVLFLQSWEINWEPWASWQTPYPWAIFSPQLPRPFYKEAASATAPGRSQEELFTVRFLYPRRLSTYDIVITTYSLLAKEIPTTKQEGEVPGANLSVEVRLRGAREVEEGPHIVFLPGEECSRQPTCGTESLCSFLFWTSTQW